MYIRIISLTPSLYTTGTLSSRWTRLKRGKGPQRSGSRQPPIFREDGNLSCVADAAAKLFLFVFVFVAHFDFIDFFSVLTKFNSNPLRNMRPLSCGNFENIIDEDEFILLYDLDTSKNSDQIECFTLQ